MGFLDALLGKRKISGPAPDRLFALTTAYISLETGHGIVTSGQAAIVFQPLATGDFSQIVTEMEEVVRGTGEETGTTLTTSDDGYGYRWMVLADPDIDDLVVGVNAVSDALAVGGYNDRVLCAVFAFRDTHPNEAELQLRAKIGTELPIEAEMARWLPLSGTLPI